MIVAMYFEAVIFDCDGTLVDSEVLGIQVLVECVAERGADGKYPQVGIIIEDGAVVG